MYIDILIYAAVAALFLYRLHTVLGTTDEEPRAQKNPYLGSAGNGAGAARPARAMDSEPATRPQPADAAASQDPIERLRRADPSFNEARFLRGAEMAFGMILEAFARGDRKTLSQLLSPTLYGIFEQAITAREQAGETMERSLTQILSLEIVDTELAAQRARVEVKYVSEQSLVVRAADGSVIDGEPGEVATLTDLWTFERDLASDDPTWHLVRTATPE